MPKPSEEETLKNLIKTLKEYVVEKNKATYKTENDKTTTAIANNIVFLTEKEIKKITDTDDYKNDAAYNTARLINGFISEVKAANSTKLLEILSSASLKLPTVLEIPAERLTGMVATTSSNSASKGDSSERPDNDTSPLIPKGRL